MRTVQRLGQEANSRLVSQGEDVVRPRGRGGKEVSETNDGEGTTRRVAESVRRGLSRQRSFAITYFFTRST